jgi:glycine dehydrogenase subunit 1
VLQTSESPEQINAQLLKQKVIGGLALSRWYPELGNASLWCTTELNTRQQIDHAASLLQHVCEEALTRA